mmetsp:Transcript_79007/g.256151  ORF Transcript_79007/g.256151 Transcript_79007/m.256151 type:complete len:330 (+) Transcript_79007:79-1068(+)|eukprot:CAMPEP_0203970168 /NCGR_PEP_ID=MMETSP0359-20131031/97827_1 /ASSEMBLY_ACC=CAM_ASM_000338 /TAXON_ID=268821 /ORGANISM="Scrippsiella Hangoei, Strain SHTV-5" /LENGTH=329 /DNA_ID=CAMNT_0050908119 /DNA_START=43 /DNA_END=1032 /DNA_ORIENTATION=-
MASGLAMPGVSLRRVLALALALACHRGTALGPPYSQLPASSSPTATFQLRDGRQMPMFGLGVYVSKPGAETYDAVKWALELGYRMVDTAMIYGNERSVGEAVRDSGIPREELWVSTKLWDADHGFEQAIAACEKSLQELGMSYIDLYLIHSPNTGKLVETWDALLELRRRGLVKSIGVSNYDVKHIKALSDHGRELPVVNQIEMHPLVYQERRPVLEYCLENNILVQAYGSIFFGQTQWLEDPAVTSVTAAHPSRTPAQVLLRWGLQMGFHLIPKSTKRHRLEENMGIFDFDLSAQELETLSSMKGALGAYWNPLETPVDLGKTSADEL